MIALLTLLLVCPGALLPGYAAIAKPTIYHFAALGTVENRAFAQAATAVPDSAHCYSQLNWSGGVMGSKRIDKSLLSVDTMLNCDSMFHMLDIYGEQGPRQREYDSAKSFILQCPENHMVSWAFGNIIAGAQGLQLKDTAIWTETRAWLESVLYLNTTDPAYFCQCVEALAQCLGSLHDTTEQLMWKDQNRSLAVIRWMLLNDPCDMPNLRFLYNNTRRSQYEQWLNDTTVPYDTTLPSMQDLGLDSLLAIHFKYAWVPSGGDFGKHVSSYSVSENPLHDLTTLRFDLSDAEYVRVEVFDVMGNNTPCPSLQKTGDGLFESGQHQIPIDFSRCASGTYYLRITLGTGEVRTIKLVKE
ncbi:MAG: hypothetical protein Q8922_07325 [Bacteroidota bacterium]|nr:hypothetical protein [Bacteroidota bacterium]MDP4233546.1 hypothetical protein [Bacteroidota bacterium]MDP4243679.1 hypothetical protein [Bacteroidota bacterium]MDP4287732.1 hypothetical protein [Bacteroidota bacterium]